MCIGVVCIYVRHHVCAVPEEVRSLGTGVTDGSEPARGCWEWNLSSREAASALNYWTSLRSYKNELMNSL